ncbi:hypothetical protein B0H63DRAFT_508806, partial [Podospora didyma]
MRIIQNWKKHCAQKVPSQISYSITSKGCDQWGYDIGDNHGLLELRSLNDLAYEIRVTHGSNEPLPIHLIKTPDEMCIDFLRLVAEETRQEIRQVCGNKVVEMIITDLVVTYDGGWSEMTRRRYYHIIESSFNSNIFPKIRHIFFVSEPEATALWYIEEGIFYNRPDVKRRGDAFILCECLDNSSIRVTSYGMETSNPQPGEWNFKQIGHSSFATEVGWDDVKRAFTDFVKDKMSAEDWSRLTDDDFSSSGGRSIIKPKLRSMLDRWQPIGEQFDGVDHKLAWPVQLPRGIGMIDDEENGILNGAIKVCSDDMERIFEHSISALESLVSKQILTIFMNGRYFAQNPYVLKKIDGLGKSRGISVKRAEESAWTATVRGAVIHALGGITPRPTPVRRAPHHHGIVRREAYDRSRHIDEDWERHPVDARQQATEQIEWLVKKGDPIFSDTKTPRHERLLLVRKFVPKDITAAKVCRVVFVACGEDSPPSRLQDLPPESSELVNLDCKLASLPKDQHREVDDLFANFDYFLEAVLYFRICINVAEIRVELLCGGS